MHKKAVYRINRKESKLIKGFVVGPLLKTHPDGLTVCSVTIFDDGVLTIDGTPIHLESLLDMTRNGRLISGFDRPFPLSIPGVGVLHLYEGIRQPNYEEASNVLQNTIQNTSIIFKEPINCHGNWAPSKPFRRGADGVIHSAQDLWTLQQTEHLWYLTDLRVYEDGFAHVYNDLDSGVFNPLSRVSTKTGKLGVEDTILFNSVRYKIQKTAWLPNYSSETPFHAWKIMAQKNGLIRTCFKAWERYSTNPNPVNAEVLEMTYNAVPPEERHYILADMDLKDRPIRMALGKFK